MLYFLVFSKSFHCVVGGTADLSSRIWSTLFNIGLPVVFLSSTAPSRIIVSNSSYLKKCPDVSSKFPQERILFLNPQKQDTLSTQGICNILRLDYNSTLSFPFLPPSMSLSHFIPVVPWVAFQRRWRWIGWVVNFGWLMRLKTSFRVSIQCKAASNTCEGFHALQSLPSQHELYLYAVSAHHQGVSFRLVNVHVESELHLCYKILRYHFIETSVYMHALRSNF